VTAPRRAGAAYLRGVHQLAGAPLGRALRTGGAVPAATVLALALVAISLVTIFTRRRGAQSVPASATVHPVPLPPTASAPGMAGAVRPAIRVADPAPATSADRVAEVLAESTRRFAAGTTYGAPQQAPPNQRTE